MDDLLQAAIENHALLRAAEDWSTEYSKDPVTHAQLLKLEGKWELDLRRFFKEMASHAYDFINWSQYTNQKNADYNVDVIVNDDNIDDYDGQFIKVSFETVATITAVGAQAGQTIYGINLGITSVDQNVQKLAMDQVAGLVGKRVLPDGTIIDNPNPEYNVTNTVRKDIAQSIKTSLGLGENLQEATDRISKVISDPMRAERIARTESVNAYQRGLRQFAIQSGAVGKEWQDAGAIDACADNTAEGPVPVNFVYATGGTEPTAHVLCKCGIRYIYAQEWDSISHE